MAFDVGLFEEQFAGIGLEAPRPPSTGGPGQPPKPPRPRRREWGGRPSRSHGVSNRWMVMAAVSGWCIVTGGMNTVHYLKYPQEFVADYPEAAAKICHTVEPVIRQANLEEWRTRYNLPPRQLCPY